MTKYEAIQKINAAMGNDDLEGAEKVLEEYALDNFRNGYKYHRGFNKKAVPYDEASELTVLDGFYNSKTENNKQSKQQTP